MKQLPCKLVVFLEGYALAAAGFAKPFSEIGGAPTPVFATRPS